MNWQPTKWTKKYKHMLVLNAVEIRLCWRKWHIKHIICWRDLETLARSLSEKFELVRSLNKRIIEKCKVEDIEHKIEEFWIKRAQTQAFSDDPTQLAAGKAVHCSSDLRSMCPYTEEQGILSFGGRLKHFREFQTPTREQGIPNTNSVSSQTPGYSC